MRKLSLLFWLIVGLAAVAFLPFAIAAYQISTSHESLVAQAQQTHLVTVRSTAQRVHAYVSLAEASARSLADNPQLHTAPGSAEAREVLTGALIGQATGRAVGVYSESPDGVQIVQLARHQGLSPARTDPLLTALEGISIGSEPPSLIIVSPTPVAGLSVRALYDFGPIAAALSPDESLEATELGLFGTDRAHVTGTFSDLDTLPSNLIEKMSVGWIQSGAARFEVEQSVNVAAFALVPGTDWVVASRQPASIAELAATRMRSASYVALTGAIAVSILLSLGAYFRVFRPIRKVVRAQQALLRAGEETTPIAPSGSEISQLQHGFEQLKSRHRDRDALSQVFLDRYQVIDVLGVGGMGTVFRGWDPRLKRDIALKTLKLDEDLPHDARRLHLELLNTEAVAIARFAHPNIVTIYDYRSVSDAAFIAMELVDGVSLEEYIRRLKKLPPNQVVHLGVAVLRALEEAHGRNIIHRDIKPANILLGRDGSIKVTDFGVALFLGHMDSEKPIMGTPSFLAPELFRKQKASARSDLFSVGVVLYHCLTGIRLFLSKDIKRSVHLTKRHDPKPPAEIADGISAPLDRLVMQMISKDPTKRPASAGAAADLLEKLEGQQ